MINVFCNFYCIKIEKTTNTPKKFISYTLSLEQLKNTKISFMTINVVSALRTVQI